MSIKNNEHDVQKDEKLSEAVMFSEKRPFGLKFLESDPEFPGPMLSSKTTRFGATATNRPQGPDTSADMIYD